MDEEVVLGKGASFPFLRGTGLDRRQYPELPADLRQWPDAALVFELNTILVQACAADARERYGNAEARRADLRLLDAGKSVKRRRSVKRGWAWTWKMAVVIALVGLGALVIKNERDRRAALTHLNASPFEKSGTTNYAAWQAFERAGKMGVDFSATGFSNAIHGFERAVALDPNYTAAWMQLSASLFLAADKGLIPADEALQRARFCAEQAVNHLSRSQLANSELVTRISSN